MMQRRRRIEDDGVQIRLGDSPPRWQQVSVAGACMLMLALTAATCWRWSGSRSRSLTFAEAVRAAETGDTEAVRSLYLQMVRARSQLLELAQRSDEVGARAKEWLALAEKK